MRATLILLCLIFISVGKSRRVHNVQNNVLYDDIWSSNSNGTDDFDNENSSSGDYVELYDSIEPPVLVYSERSMNPKIRFYHDSFENYTELDFDVASAILSTDWYDESKTTMVFSHGFTGHPSGVAVTRVIKQYLEEGNHNVALLNWEKMAAVQPQSNHMNSYLTWATPNSIKIGLDFADVLIALSNNGFDLDKLHLIGHSLGAQMFGITGYKLAEKGIKLRWFVICCDPARVSFERKPPNLRLSPESALFVDVIHTDPSKYGSRRELGHVDFWPNYRSGLVTQPGCTNQIHRRFSPEDLCNHHRCWQLLIDAMKYPERIMGSWAKNFRNWKNYSEKDRNSNVLGLGVFDPHATHGNYYFTTTDKSPYGLGKDGL